MSCQCHIAIEKAALHTKGGNIAFWYLPGEHVVEQVHVTSSRNIPAEVSLHLTLLQSAEAFPVVVVQSQGALQGSHEVVGVVALEGVRRYG